MSIEEYKERVEEETRQTIARYCQAHKIDLKQFAHKVAAGLDIKECQSGQA